MKIYTLTINQTAPADQTIYCPPHSTFFIAPKIVDAEGIAQEFTFIDGDGVEMPAYPQLIAERKVYPYVSGEPSVKNLKLVVPPQTDEDSADAEAQTYTIKLVTTTSTVFDVDLTGEAGGAKPQDAGQGINVTDRGIISVNTNVIPTYEGSKLHLGMDKEVDLDGFATNSELEDLSIEIQNAVFDQHVVVQYTKSPDQPAPPAIRLSTTDQEGEYYEDFSRNYNDFKADYFYIKRIDAYGDGWKLLYFKEGICQQTDVPGNGHVLLDSLGAVNGPYTLVYSYNVKDAFGSVQMTGQYDDGEEFAFDVCTK